MSGMVWFTGTTFGRDESRGFSILTLYCSIPRPAFEHLRRRPGWIAQPQEGGYEVAASPARDGAGCARIRDLLVGLELLTVAREADRSELRLIGGRAKPIGRRMRGTRFRLRPNGFRHGTSPWDEIDEAARTGLLSTAAARASVR